MDLTIAKADVKVAKTYFKMTECDIKMAEFMTRIGGVMTDEDRIEDINIQIELVKARIENAKAKLERTIASVEISKPLLDRADIVKIIDTKAMQLKKEKLSLKGQTKKLLELSLLLTNMKNISKRLRNILS
ncbi:MAG: hypothetical protein LE180_05290 [Endomicrobium sp.]|uniref:hypothetical protein n=1 Tax=Candidatus Endomicrobiellum pyrsonymphae TaxID=1408203 RepID=UPI003573FB71|nr:hypothetical protein [Endomicrobium sp.]